MTLVLRKPVLVLIAVLIGASALTACDSVEQGLEAGQSAAETVQELNVDVDGLLGEKPADASAAKTAVAGALSEVAGKAGGNATVMRSAVALIREKVAGWDMAGGEEIVNLLADLETRLGEDEVDVQAAVDDAVGQLEGGETE